MAIFANTSYNIPVVEGYSLETCGHMDAAIESFSDDLAVMEAMHAYDLAEIEGLRKISTLREAGEETEDEEEELKETLESKGSELKAKIKDKLQKLWAKVKAFFASVKRYLLGLFQHGEKFVKANEKAIKAAENANISFEVTSYKYKWDDLLSDPKTLTKSAEDLLNKIKGMELKDTDKDDINKQPTTKERFKKHYDDDYEDYLKKMYGSTDEDDRETKLFNMVRGDGAKVNGKSTYTIKSSDLSTLKNFLLKAKTSRAYVDEVSGKLDKAFSSAISDIDKVRDEKNSASTAYYVLNLRSTTLSKISTDINAYMNAWSKGIKEASGVAQTILRKACTKAGYKIASGSSSDED